MKVLVDKFHELSDQKAPLHLGFQFLIMIFFRSDNFL